MLKFSISGGPGAGKSTLLKALRVSGFYCSDEVSRQLIQEQVSLNSRCLPWIDLRCFANLALGRMVAEHQRASIGTGIAFFDRAIPDIIAYLRVGGLPVDESFYGAVERYSYQQLVFMAPPWEAIYVNDEERWQTFAEATALYQALVDMYQSLGFTIVTLPKVSVAERVAFVLTAIQQYVGEPVVGNQPSSQPVNLELPPG